MKIYGTAKGGALNKKDFGVAFGGGELEPTYETDFSSDTGWDKTGTVQEISSGVLNYNSVPNNSIQTISHTLTSAASDTAYVLRYTNVIDHYAQNSGQDQMLYMGLSDENHSSGGGDTQDYLMQLTMIDGSKNVLAVMECDGQNPTGEAQSSNYDAFSVGSSETTFYPEHTRLSATSFKIELDYTSPTEAVTLTIPSTVISLDNIKLSNRSNGASVETTNINGKLDDLKFYDNVTSV